MDFEKSLKDIAWTELEVLSVITGAVAATQFLDDTKLFKNDFATNPAWFQADRAGAKFYIKWSGAIKAGGALLIAQHVKNPWAKLFLMGVAMQGTLQQVRILTYDQTKGDFRYPQLGQANQAELDAELKSLADSYRSGTSGPKYLGDAGNRYTTQVADPGNRYSSQVAGIYDELEPIGFSFADSDGTAAH